MLLLEAWLWTTAASAVVLLVVMGLQRLLLGPAGGRPGSRGLTALARALVRAAARPAAPGGATRAA